MTTFDHPWGGPKPVVTRGLQPNQYTVKFHAPPSPVGVEDGRFRAWGAKGIAIFVQAEPGGNLCVLGFVGTAQPFPGLGLEDFTRRAIDEVRAVVMSN